MASVKNTFICPSCSSGINVADGQRPETCPGCGHRFGALKQVFYRLPKPLIQQYRERLEARKSTIPPMPTEQDTAEVNAKDAKARYMEQQNVQILAEEQERLRQCIIGMSEPYLKDTIDSFARIVMTSSQLSEATRKYLAYTLQHCAAVIDNVQKGHAMGVDYGTQNARPFSGDSDSVDSGARGISITDGSSPSSTVSK